jgi:hypothetical protein
LVDKDFTDQTFTTAEGWTFINNKGGKLTSTCAGLSLAGGFNVFGVKALATKT